MTTPAERVTPWATASRVGAPSSRDGSVQLTLPDDRTAYDVTVSASDGSSDGTVPTDPTAPRRITATTSDGDIGIAPAG